MELTHFDEGGKAAMVDVSAKGDTVREAVAVGHIAVSEECFALIAAGTAEKGDVLGVARVAGIQGAKRTADLIPLCHPLALTRMAVDFTLNREMCRVEVSCTTRCTGKTGVEMEALTGATVALLTIYDMCKAVDKTMTMGGVYLRRKTGGKSGLIQNAAPRGEG